MKVSVRIGKLQAIDSGESTAEPYLWPLFFKIDAETFGYALRAKVATGELGPAALEARGVDSGVFEAAPTHFDAPGGEHRNLPSMSSGDTHDVGLTWTTTLRDGGPLIQRGDAVVGVALVLWEEDTFPSNSRVTKEYAQFVRDMERRIEHSVLRAFEQTKDSGEAATFGYRTKAGDRPTAPFFPESIEGRLQDRFRGLYRAPMLDTDDFIGAAVWVRSTRQLRARPNATQSKLWTPTTGSREGSWRLDLAITASE